jgi:hypothetical protein
MAIDPRMMEFSHWTGLVAGSLSEHGQVAPESDEANWHDFAAGVAKLPVWSSGDIPDSRGYDKWQDWGARVYESSLRLGI